MILLEFIRELLIVAALFVLVVIEMEVAVMLWRGDETIDNQREKV